MGFNSVFKGLKFLQLKDVTSKNAPPHVTAVVCTWIHSIAFVASYVTDMKEPATFSENVASPTLGHISDDVLAHSTWVCQPAVKQRFSKLPGVTDDSSP